jgi:hypothetical protein
VLATFGVGQVFWAFPVFFLWIIWICLLIAVFFDIFRSRDLSGPEKALCVLGVLLLPYLGVFVYLVICSDPLGPDARACARVRRGPRASLPRTLAAGHAEPRSRHRRRGVESLGRAEGPVATSRSRVRATQSKALG